MRRIRFNSNRIRHRFCKQCGVRSFGWAELPQGGRMFVVYVSCLNDVEHDELADVPIMFVDGRNDHFQSPPAETRHL